MQCPLFKLDLSNPSFPPRANLNEKTLAIVGTDTLKWIGIAPFATYESKMYPLDTMEEVIAKLSKTYKILLFGGGQHEVDILNGLEKDFENVING